MLTRSFLAVPAATTLLLCATTFVADSHAGSLSDERTDADLSEISITASMTPIEANNAGSALTILMADDIRRRGARNLGELLRQVPGFQVSENGALGSLTQVRVRGTEANHVLVIIDGVVANDVAQGGEVNYSHILTSQIHRVEILRGPQSALYGSDAVAGVVHVTTHHGKMPGNVSLTLGDLGFSELSATTQLETGDTSATLSITSLRTDGTNIARTGTEDDGYENLTIAGSLKGTIGHITVGANIRHSDSEADFDTVDFLTTGLPVDAFNVTESTQTYGGINLGWALSSAVRQSLRLGMTETDNQNRFEAGAPSAASGGRNQLNLQTDYAISDHHAISMQLSRVDLDYSQRGATAFGSDPNKDLSASTDSIALEYRYVSNRFAASASLRQDSNSDFGDADAWRVTGTWHLADDTALFGSVGESFKNPTFTERFGFFDTFIGNPDLMPETAESIELGLRQSFARGDISLSLFNAELTNEINGFAFDVAAGGFTAANLEGQSERSGIELSARWQPSDLWQIDAAVTSIDSTQPDAMGSQIREVRRPEISASVNVSRNIGDGFIAVGAVHNGDQDDVFFPPTPPYQETVVLPGYTLLHAGARLPVGQQLTLSLRADNLLDETYEDVFGFRAPGRGFRVGLIWQP